MFGPVNILMRKGMPTDLNERQMKIVRDIIPEKARRRLRSLTLESIVNAIAYVVKTGCRWNMLPTFFPKPRSVYHHFRSWSDRGWFDRLLKILVGFSRLRRGMNESPSVAVVDSQSVRQNLPHSEKGVDGYKRVKGIKRHISVDSNGYPLEVMVTTANIHDSRGAIPLMVNTLDVYPSVTRFKADKGYRTALTESLKSCCNVDLECVKSNFGTSEFIPAKGRWVVERTFSWLENYRRLARNYEQFVRTARHMAVVACSMFMLRYFR